jgi:hypothetical protein
MSEYNLDTYIAQGTMCLVRYTYSDWSVMYTMLFMTNRPWHTALTLKVKKKYVTSHSLTYTHTLIYQLHSDGHLQIKTR